MDWESDWWETEIGATSGVRDKEDSEEDYWYGTGTKGTRLWG